MIIYDINKEKRTIIARFKDGRKEGKWYWRCCLMSMCHCILSSTYTGAPVDSIVDKVIDSYTEFIGKATCHLYDEWDEEKGKQIAKQRLLEKWRKMREQVLWKLNDSIIDNYIDTMNRLNKKLLKGE